MCLGEETQNTVERCHIVPRHSGEEPFGLSTGNLRCTIRLVVEIGCLYSSCLAYNVVVFTVINRR